MRNLWLTVVPAILLAIVALLYVGIGSVFEVGSPVAHAGGGGHTWTADTPGIGAKEHPLPMPSTKTLSEFQEILFPWILSRTYDKDLGWARDKTVRDTGPYVKGQYYGTHPAVRCWYSPKMMYWMTGDPSFWPEGNVKKKAPREGDIPDGAMIIKEMFTPPAARWEGKTKEEIDASLFTPTAPGWTVMIKEKEGAVDGWWWGSVWKDQHIDTPDRFHYPEGGFGMACVRCHSVAKEGGTFSALRNVKGFSMDPLQFFNDETWRDIPNELQPFVMTHGTGLPELGQLATQRDPGPCLPNAEFLMTFSQTRKVCLEAVKHFPPESNDHVVNKPSNIKHYLTSDQCMGCHSGANSKYAFGPIMFLETAIGGLNVSPYGEWRWSPMGLAGRDPVFHAQLESELSQLKRELGDEKGKFFGDQLTNTCLRCHGAMGKRQWDHDKGVGDEYWKDEAKFDPEWYYLTDQKNPHNEYGALARDGISCAICHSMVEEYPDFNEFLANSITGQFKVGPPDEVYGPFEDVVITPMEVATGKKAKHSEFISSSRLCASCHIINLPVVDWPLDGPAPPAPHGHKHDPIPQEEIDQLLASEKNPNFKGFLHRIEQATYLEWVNSKYQDEYGKTEDSRSCQDCHMPNEYHNEDGSIRVDPIITKIATIEDEDYPEADYRIPLKDMTVKLRKEGYRRHTFQGLNVFLAEMFHQHGDVLGVRQGDFETGTNGLPFAIKNFVQQARESTAKIEIMDLKHDKQTIEAKVKVTNLTGHRLPSGVGFRRIWIEGVVIDEHHGAQRIIWGSGQTNRVGVILGENGEPLPEEWFEEDENGHQRYHHHHNLITSQDQVQVYEELATNAKGKFTTSFIHRAHHAKENRLLPMGWKREGPEGSNLPAAFLKATWPGHETDKDPEWQDGSGTDVLTYKITLPDHYDAKKVKIRFRLYSQSWAPYYLKDRFTDIPEGPEGDARRRLYYLASHLKTDGTPIEDWKLLLVEASNKVGEPLGESAKSQHYEYRRKHEPEKLKEEEEKMPGYREGKGCG